jgi:FMN phosphatase YigB (HAD superfamily)
MPVKAIFFDFFGVIYHDGEPDDMLLDYVQVNLKPHYKLGIITSTRDVGKYIDRKLLEATFDALIASSEVGLYKPDLAIFQFASAQFNVKPNESLLIDDIPENCEGARAAGMKTIVYKDFNSLRHELQRVLPGAVQ